MADDLKTLNAIDRINEIIPKCRSFKIGKTGDTLHNRFGNYDGEYNHILGVYSGTELEVDAKESELIDRYIDHPKNDNIRDGETSYGDEMAPDSETYQVYVVWK